MRLLEEAVPDGVDDTRNPAQNAQHDVQCDMENESGSCATVENHSHRLKILCFRIMFMKISNLGNFSRDDSCEIEKKSQRVPKN